MNIKQYKKVLKNNLINFLPWKILTEADSKEYSLGLKKRYKNRDLICFAVRTDSDDIACWDLSSNNEKKVYIIHDFSSEGWEHVDDFESFQEWFHSALNDFFEFEEDSL